MPKAKLGQTIRLNQRGANFINGGSPSISVVAKAGDKLVICRNGSVYAKALFGGVEWNMDDSEYSVVPEVEEEAAQPEEVTLEVGTRVRLNKKGLETMSLLGKPLGTDIRVAGFLAGWVRLMDPAWEAPGHLFGRSEFEVVPEEPVEPDLPKVVEAMEVRAIEVRLYDVIWDGSAKAFTVERIAKYGEGGVVFFGYTGSGIYTDDTRKLDEYVTLSGRRE